MRAPGNRVFSLTQARWLPERRRREWQQDLVRFQIDEINGVYDGLALSVGTAAHDERLARARARVERMLRAARWLPEPFERELQALLATPLEEPEDAFGVAVLLIGLGLDSPAIRAWLGDLDTNVLARLGELALRPPPALASPSQES